MVEPLDVEVLDDGSAVVDVKCGVCEEVKSVRVDLAAYTEWRNGALIQNVMPQLSASQRELLISGTCGPCFDKLFPAEEE